MSFSTGQATLIGQSVNANPAVVFTQGDTAVINLTAIDGEGNPINLAGASFSTQIKGPTNGAITIFPNSQHTIINASLGQFTLSLASADTMNCGEGDFKTILTQITISASVVYYRGIGILNVLPAIPLQ